MDTEFKEVYTEEQVIEFTAAAKESQFKNINIELAKKSELIVIIGDLVTRLKSVEPSDNRRELDACKINLKVLKDENADLKTIIELMKIEQADKENKHRAAIAKLVGQTNARPGAQHAPVRTAPQVVPGFSVLDNGASDSWN